jgi:hypothetical protein
MTTVPTLTVMTPSLPTFFMASAIKFPISLSPLAEIVATYAENISHQPSSETEIFIFLLVGIKIYFLSTL